MSTRRKSKFLKGIFDKERRKFSKRAEALAKARNEIREQMAYRQVKIIASIMRIYFDRHPEEDGIYDAVMNGETYKVRQFMEDEGIEMLYEQEEQGLQTRKLTWKQNGEEVVSLIQGYTISYEDEEQKREFKFCVREAATGNEYPILFESDDLGIGRGNHLRLQE